MGMSQEQAAAAMHAAKFAQLGAMGHNLDKLSPGMLPQQFDLSKLREHNQIDIDSKMLSTPSVTIEPTSKFNSSLQSDRGDRDRERDRERERDRDRERDRIDVRRRSTEPMDLGNEMNMNDNRVNHDDHNRNDGVSSGDEANYSDEEGAGHS